MKNQITLATVFILAIAPATAQDVNSPLQRLKRAASSYAQLGATQVQPNSNSSGGRSAVNELLDFGREFARSPQLLNGQPSGSPGASWNNSAAPEFSISVPGAQGGQNAPNAVPALTGLRSSVGTFVKRLSAQDLSVLSSRDIVILIDKSGSMGDKDCPPPQQGLRFSYRDGEPESPVSRWDWCENELVTLANEARSSIANGIRVVLFDNRQTVFDHVDMSKIPYIFHNNYPEGGTNEAAALKSQLDWYLQNRDASGGRVRPLAIAVITDGLPNNVSALRKVIEDATQQLRQPDEVAITFLQVGTDKKGVKLVHELDDNLVQHGARFDIVDCKDFAELTHIGLAKALVDAVNESARSAMR